MARLGESVFRLPKGKSNYIKRLLSRGFVEARPKKPSTKIFFGPLTFNNVYPATKPMLRGDTLFDRRVKNPQRIFCRHHDSILYEMQVVYPNRCQVFYGLDDTGVMRLSALSRKLRVIAQLQRKLMIALHQIGIRRTEPYKDLTVGAILKRFEQIDREKSIIYKETASFLATIRMRRFQDWYYLMRVGQNIAQVKAYVGFLVALRDFEDSRPWPTPGGSRPGAGPKGPNEAQIRLMVRLSEKLQKSGRAVIKNPVDENVQQVAKLNGVSRAILDKLLSVVKETPRFKLAAWADKTAYEIVMRREGTGAAVKKYRSNLPMTEKE